MLTVESATEPLSSSSSLRNKLEQFQSSENISTYPFFFLEGDSAPIFTACFNEVTEEAPRTCFTFNLLFVFCVLVPLWGALFGLGPGRLREKTVLKTA